MGGGGWGKIVIKAKKLYGLFWRYIIDRYGILRNVTHEEIQSVGYAKNYRYFIIKSYNLSYSIRNKISYIHFRNVILKKIEILKFISTYKQICYSDI